MRLTCDDAHELDFRPAEVHDVPFRLGEGAGLEPKHLGDGMVVLQQRVERRRDELRNWCPTPTRTTFSTVPGKLTLSRPTSVTRPNGPARLGVRMSVLGPTIVSSLFCSAVELIRRSSSESMPPWTPDAAGGRSCIVALKFWSSGMVGSRMHPCSRCSALEDSHAGCGDEARPAPRVKAFFTSDPGVQAPQDSLKSASRDCRSLAHALLAVTERDEMAGKQSC